MRLKRYSGRFLQFELTQITKGEGTVDHKPINRSINKFHLDYISMGNQAMSGRAKTVDYETVLQAILANPMSNIGRVSGKASIAKSSVTAHNHHLIESSRICKLSLTLLKYCTTFDSLWYYSF